MTPERLQFIKENAEGLTSGYGQMFTAELVQEIERLQAELAANRPLEILQVMWRARLTQCNAALKEPTPHLEKSIEALIKELEQARAYAEKVVERREQLASDNAGLLLKLEQAKERERLLREALTFYADPETYFAIGFFPDRPCGEFVDDFEDTELGRKPGKRARVALTVPPAQEQPTWQYGCGWTNGVNLAKCAMCGRTPAESFPPKEQG